MERLYRVVWETLTMFPLLYDVGASVSVVIEEIKMQNKVTQAFLLIWWGIIMEHTIVKINFIKKLSTLCLFPRYKRKGAQVLWLEWARRRIQQEYPDVIVTSDVTITSDVMSIRGYGRYICVYQDCATWLNGMREPVCSADYTITERVIYDDGVQYMYIYPPYRTDLFETEEVEKCKLFLNNLERQFHAINEGA